MKVNSNRHDTVDNDINSLRYEPSLDEHLKYRIHLLEKTIKIVAKSYPDCQHCQRFRKNISDSVRDLRYVSMTSREFQTYYFMVLSQVNKHIRRKHKYLSSK